MRFEWFRVEHFGKLAGFEVRDLGGLVVLFGPNEAGKSTLFHAFASLLFGFLPSNLKSNPYTPWDGGRMEISGNLRLDTGDEARVSRRMTADIRGWYQTEGNGWEIGNAALPFLDRISREVYSEVYALGARDLEFFGERTWQEVQGGLIPGLAPDFLIPVEQVLSDIDKEMNSLWRPTRHRNTRARAIQEDLTRLRVHRKAIEDREKTCREKRARLQAIEGEKEALTNRKIAMRALLRKADRLIPVHRTMVAMEEALERAGTLQEIEDFPENPGEFMEMAHERIRRLEERRESLMDKARKHSERVAGFNADMEAIIKRESVIEALAEEIPLWSSESRDIEAIQREMLILNTRIGEASKDLLSEEVDPLIFLTLPRADLLEATRAFEKADTRLRAEEEQIRGREDQATPRRCSMPVPSAIVLVISLSLAIAGIVSGRLWMVLTGAVLGTIAGGSLVAWYRIQEDYRRVSSVLRAHGLNRQALRDERDEHHRRVKGLLEHLPIAERRLENPDTSLIQDLMEIRNSAEALNSLQSKARHLEHGRRRREERLERLAQEMGVSFDTHEAFAREIVNMLYKARDAARQRDESREALDEIEAEVTQLDVEIEQSRGAMETLMNRLISLGEGTLDEGIQHLDRRRDALKRFSILEEELQGQPDLEALKTEIKELAANGEIWIIGDEEVERARTVLEGIDEDLRGLEIEAASINEALLLTEGPTLDDVDSEISASRLKLEETAVRRDRLLLLRNVLSEAERRFKEEHQPDVLKRAGLYLQSMTRGAYQCLSMGGARGKPQIMVHPRNGLPVPAANPLSRGTLDQIYLALRLSLVDHLDEERESLPIFLDEALVNWGDGERLDDSLLLLCEVSEHRQVFLFTSHGWLPERLKKLNAQSICLS